MKKAELDKLTAALEGAGFEVVSLKEETMRHLRIAEQSVGSVFSSVGVTPGLKEETGITLLEIRRL
jgi:hypothetical protein